MQKSPCFARNALLLLRALRQSLKTVVMSLFCECAGTPFLPREPATTLRCLQVMLLAKGCIIAELCQHDIVDRLEWHPLSECALHIAYLNS